jgi:hypothetical protein
MVGSDAEVVPAGMADVDGFDFTRREALGGWMRSGVVEQFRWHRVEHGDFRRRCHADFGEFVDVVLHGGGVASGVAGDHAGESVEGYFFSGSQDSECQWFIRVHAVLLFRELVVGGEAVGQDGELFPDPAHLVRVDIDEEDLFFVSCFGQDDAGWIDHAAVPA